jgi:hypothetical protein
MDFEIHRSRFFTFLFFMQKLSRNSLDKFNKSCSVFHEESKKIEFTFFWVFYYFLGIWQESAKLGTLFKIHFLPRSLELSQLSQICLYFTKTTPERVGCLQCSPWGLGGGRPKSGGVVVRERWGRGLRAHHSSVLRRKSGWGGAGDGLQRRQPAPAAGPFAPASSRPGQGIGRHGVL